MKQTDVLHIPRPCPEEAPPLAGDFPGTLGEGKWTYFGPSFSLETAVPDIPADPRPWASWDFTRSQGFTPSFTRSLSSPLPPAQSIHSWGPRWLPVGLGS